MLSATAIPPPVELLHPRIEPGAGANQGVRPRRRPGECAGGPPPARVGTGAGTPHPCPGDRGVTHPAHWTSRAVRGSIARMSVPGGEAPSRAGRARQSKAVGRRYRGGTIGAGPVRERTTKPSASAWARFRYRLDNALSRGAWVVIGYLGLVTLAIVVLAAVITVIAHLIGFGGGGQRLGVLESFWQMLVRVVDAGSFASDATWPTRLLALLVTLAGIFIAGSLIGLISSSVDQRVDALRRGRSNVLEHGHTLILGWSPRVPTISVWPEQRAGARPHADPGMVGPRGDHPRIS